MLPIAVIIVLAIVAAGSAGGIIYYNRSNSKKIKCPKYYASCTDTSFTCPKGFTKTDLDCACPEGYVTGSGPDSICNKCPDYAKCSTDNFECPDGFTKNINTCDCDTTDYVVGSGASAVCTDCPKNALCDGSNNFKCPSELFTKTNTSCDCINGYITTSEGVSICNRCPVYSSCDGNTFKCKNGFQRIGTKCVCDSSKYISGTGPSAECIECPEYGICNGSTYRCPTGFYSSDSGCVCDDFIFGTGPSLACLDRPPRTTVKNGEFVCESPYIMRDKLGCVCYNGTGYVGRDENCNRCPQYAHCDGINDFDCARYGFTKIGNACDCTGYISSNGDGTYQCVRCPEYAMCSSGSFTCMHGFSKDGNRCICNGYTTIENIGGVTGTVCNVCPMYGDCSGNRFSCQNGFTGINGRCECAGGYIRGTGPSAICTNCPPYVSCIDPYNPTCLSGLSMSRDSNNAVSCLCPTGQYIDNEIGQCMACPAYGRCNGTDTYFCPTGFNRSNGRCSCDGYIPGFTDPSIPRTCNPCPIHSTCNGIDFSCQDPLTKNNTECICPDNTPIVGEINSARCTANAMSLPSRVNVIGRPTDATFGTAPNPYGVTNEFSGNARWITLPNSIARKSNTFYRFSRTFNNLETIIADCKIMCDSYGIVWLNDTRIGVTRDVRSVYTFENLTIKRGANIIHVDVINTSRPSIALILEMTGVPATATNNTDTNYWTAVELSSSNTPCPENSSRTNAGIDTGYMGCSCAPTHGFDYDISKCVRCPGNSLSTNTGELVEFGCRCPPNFEWDVLTSNCVQCPGNTSVRNTGIVVPVIGSSSICKCPAGMEWNGTSCVGCPDGSTVIGSGQDTNVSGCKCHSVHWAWNPTTNVCDQCPGGSTVVGTDLATPSNPNCKCNDYHWAWNGAECAQCPSYSWRHGQGTGPPTSVYACHCPNENWVWVPEEGRCHACPPGSKSTGVGQETNRTGCKCTNEFMRWNGSSCEGCPGFAAYNYTGPDTANPGCKCRDTGWIWNGTTNSCEACPENSVSAGGTGAPTNKPGCRCQNNHWGWNGATQKCEVCPAYSNAEGTGEQVPGMGCKCLDRNYYWNGSVCVRCPAGSSLDGSNTPFSTIPEHPKCKCVGANRYWKPNLGICDECPRDSYNVHSGHPDVAPQNNWNGAWVPEGHGAWNTLGQTPGALCRCAYHMRWFDGHGCLMR
jgi:hypothetical protein